MRAAFKVILLAIAVVAIGMSFGAGLFVATEVALR